jgi:hypothetical protein
MTTSKRRRKLARIAAKLSWLLPFRVRAPKQADGLIIGNILKAAVVARADRALLSVSLGCAASSLPFAVGIYLPLQTSFPIFLGGVARWVVDGLNPPKVEESESSPGVLLCSGYIAGGALVGVAAAFLNFKEEWLKQLNLAPALDRLFGEGTSSARWTTMLAFAVMVVLLLVVGLAGRFSRKEPAAAQEKD